MADLRRDGQAPVGGSGFRDAGGEAVTPADMDQGVRLFRRILAPHIIKDRSK